MLGGGGGGGGSSRERSRGGHTGLRLGWWVMLDLRLRDETFPWDVGKPHSEDRLSSFRLVSTSIILSGLLVTSRGDCLVA